MEDAPSIVPLHHVASKGSGTTTTTNTKPQPTTPTTVFLHGLDSSSHTWKSIQSKLSTPSIALDLRGCGQSPMGPIDDFTVDNVVQDIHHVLSVKLQLEKPIVLVGHSMGGKIASYYTAKYPQHVAALIIEDMDIQNRPVASNPIPLNMSVVRGFERKFDTLEEAIDRLHLAGYPKERIQRWVDEGRIHPWKASSGEDEARLKKKEDCAWWSDVNPEFRALCYQRFFANESATDAWKKIASLLRGDDNSKENQPAFTFPCHLWVAGKDGTVCSEESIRAMSEILMDPRNDKTTDSSSSSRLQIRLFEKATHSIHNSAQEEYLSLLNGIIQSIDDTTT